jgi:hypothetical protein
MAIKTLRVFAEFTSTGFVPMPTAAGIDYGFTVANTYPASQPSTFQTDNPDLVVTVTAQTDFYVWIRLSGTAWNPSYTRNVRVYPDSPDINSVVMNMIIATGPAGTSAYSQIVQTSNRLYFNGATTDTVYNSKFAGKTYINELNFGTAPQLATVATSGAYADLTGKPALSTVATSGSYADLSNKPSGTAPISYNSGTNSFQISVASASTNGYLTSTDWSTFNAKYLLPSGGTTAQYLRGDGTLATFPTTLDSTRLILSGKNSTGTTLTKGTVVYINGVQGNTPLFARALATGDSTSAQTVGIVEFDIANNSTGVVVVVGIVGNLDTSSFTEGVQLYLSGTTAGAFTSAKTLAPTHLVYVGIVTRAHPTQGTIEVKIQNGYELNEIHDVQISSPANKDILYRDTATSLWKHASIASVLGYTPYNATNPNNYIALTALSASAPLSYNNTTGAFTISQANTTTNGFLSSTDWNTFNSKQSALTIGNFTEVNSNVFMFPDGGTGKTIGNLSIQMIQAGASTNGYLSSTDWTTFNNKQNAITLTTTGTSGAATFSSGTLNIPQYQTALTNPVTGTGTANYVTKWTSSSAVSNSQIFDNGTNVGVGTASPTSKLDVLGIIRASASSTQFFEIGYDTGANQGYIQSVQTGVAYRNTLINPNGGNVGIGTFSPSINLHILKSTSGEVLRIESTATNTGSVSPYLQFVSANQVGGTNFSSGYIGTMWSAEGNGFSMAFATKAVDGGQVERLRITNSGNVGIGTSSPGYKLSVVGGNGADMIQWTDNANNTGYLGIRGGGVVWMAADNNLVFATAATERMRITSAGNVGIGTDSPSGGGGSTDRTLSVNAGAGAAAFMTGMVGGTRHSTLFTSSSIFVVETNTAIPIAFNTNGTERMRITSGGNVGIGTTSPGDKLVVAGTGANTQTILQTSSASSANAYLVQASSNKSYLIGLSGDIANGYIIYDNSANALRLMVSSGGNILLGTASDPGYKLYVSGTIYATGNITANSDLTLKKNLKLVENPIDKLNQLNGYLYQWKENDEYQYGVIAQEVEKILPHAVSTGKDGIKGVSYNQIIPVLIEAVKELNAEVKLLKAK